MLSRNRVSWIGSLLLLATPLGTGCQPTPPPPLPSVTNLKQDSSLDSAFRVSDWNYYLLPIQPGMEVDAEEVQRVWRNLLSGMAEDKQTRELLTRLHGGWPTEFIMVDAPQAQDREVFRAPPGDGISIAMRVADIELKEVETRRGTVPIRVIDYGLVTRIRDTHETSLDFSSLEQPLPQRGDEPLPGDPLDLAMEDYILRHAPGWVLRRGPAFVMDPQILIQDAEAEKLPANVDEQRRELYEKFQLCEDRAKAYYGIPSKQP